MQRPRPSATSSSASSLPSLCPYATSASHRGPSATFRLKLDDRVRLNTRAGTFQQPVRTGTKGGGNLDREQREGEELAGPERHETLLGWSGERLSDWYRPEARSGQTGVARSQRKSRRWRRPWPLGLPSRAC